MRRADSRISGACLNLVKQEFVGIKIARNLNLLKKRGPVAGKLPDAVNALVDSRPRPSLMNVVEGGEQEAGDDHDQAADPGHDAVLEQVEAGIDLVEDGVEFAAQLTDLGPHRLQVGFGRNIVHGSRRR